MQNVLLALNQKSVRDEKRIKKPYALADLTKFNNHVLQKCDEAHLLLVDSNKLILFTLTEYRICLLLFTHLGETLPFEEFFQGSFDSERDRGILFKHMTHLREKIAWLGLDIMCCNAYGYTLLCRYP